MTKAITVRIDNLEKRMDRLESSITSLSQKVEGNALKLERLIAKLEQRDNDRKATVQMVAAISSVISVLISTILKIVLGG